jgi:hypothetical protein
VTNRYRTVRATAGALLLAAALTACGADEPEASGSGSPTGAPGAAVATSAPVPAAPSATARPASPAPASTGGGSVARPAPPASPVQLPPRPDGVPTAKSVVDAFRAAGLPVTGARDASADCGPDGLGLGCSELMTTGAVTVYVYPDSTSAEEIATTWGENAHQAGMVVLRYADAAPKADRARYERVLAGLV